jgi:hypothetical protein
MWVTPTTIDPISEPLENRQHAAQEIPPTDDSVNANNDDSYEDDQLLMDSQSQNHLESYR